MLIAITEDKAGALLNLLSRNYTQARVIGRVLPRSLHSVVVG
jgi:hydrogenase maturation factor